MTDPMLAEDLPLKKEAMSFHGSLDEAIRSDSGGINKTDQTIIRKVLKLLTGMTMKCMR